MVSRSEESKHPGQSMNCQAFIRLSRSDLGVFVFARQAAAAGVADSSSSLGNMYDKRDWNQHKPVRGGRAGLMFFSEPLVGGTQCSWRHITATRRCKWQQAAEGECVCSAHASVPCVQVGCGACSVCALRLFHRAAQSGKQRRAWAAPRRNLAYQPCALMCMM